MKKTVFISILMFSLMTSGFANRVNVEILSRLRADGIDIEELEKRRQKYGYIAGDDDKPSDQIDRYNAFMEIMRSEFPSRIPDIEYKTGSNANVKVTHDIPESITNFVLDFGFYIFMDELKYGVQNEDYPGIQAVYNFMFYASLIDPHTNRIVGKYKIHGQWTSETHLSAEEMAEMALKLLEEDQMPKVEELEADIKHYTNYHNATIRYSETDQQANGINTGTVTVSNIQDILIGEARNNTVCRFRLEAEKGKFTQTGTNWVEFDGKDMYYGGDKISFEYQTYNCSDFENDKGNNVFTLKQISLMSEGYNNIVKKQVIGFSCDVLYDVKVKYYAKDFAQAEWVWKNVMIVFPDENGSNITRINGDSYSGDESEIIPPYIVTVAGYGDEHFYSMCEDEYDTPEVIMIKSLMGGNAWLATGEDALNYLQIGKTPENPATHIELEFDLNIEEMQMAIHLSPDAAEEMLTGQTCFKVKSLDQDIINKLSGGNSATLDYTNKYGATIKLEFEPK